MLLLSMFCNALASLVAMLTYMEQKQAVFRKHKKLTLAAAAVLSWIGSLAGFGDLNQRYFPGVRLSQCGILGVLMILRFNS